MKILICILILIPLNACYLPCPSYTEVTFEEICGGCAPCVYSNLTQRAECTYDLQNYFHADGDCRVLNKCNIKQNVDQCKPFECLPMFGSFRCDCDKTTFGKHCEFNKPEGVSDENYAVIADIILTPLFNFIEFGTMAIFFNVIGANVIVKIITHHELLIYNSQHCKQTVLADYCKKWFGFLPHLCIRNPNLQQSFKCVMTITFIFPPFTSAESVNINDDMKMTLGAHMHFINVTVYNNVQTISELPIFYESYQIINLFQYFWYNDFPCETEVRLRGVGRRMYNWWFLIKDEIVITSSISPKPSDKCVNVDKPIYHWSMWRVSDVNFDEFAKPLVELFTSTSLVFKPFSLTKGHYKVKLIVTIWKDSLSVFSFATGYFEVVELSLEAIISGGEERSVYYKTKYLKLDGSLSQDPNLSPSEQLGNLQFFWKCNRTDVDFCKEQQSDYGIIYLGPFIPNEAYTFYLTVKSVKYNRKEDTTSQVIFMSRTKQFLLELICRKNCGWGSFHSNPSVLIYFEAVIHDFPSSSNGYKNFTWAYKIGENEYYTPVENIRQNNTPTNVLIVLKNTLLAGENYIFLVKGDEGIGEAKFHVKMAKKLTNITCRHSLNEFESSYFVRKSKGFKIECDKVKFKKISPTFNFYDKYLDENDTGRLISSSKSNTEQFTALVRGKILVEITDEYGMTIFTEVDIKSENLHDNKTDIFEQIRNFKEKESTGDTHYKIYTMSIIFDLIDSNKYYFSDFRGIIEEMLRTCAELEINDISDLKMLSSLLLTISASGDLKSNLSMESIRYLSKATNNLSRKLVFTIKKNVNLTDVSEMPLVDVYKLCNKVLKICESIYESSLLDLNERLVKHGYKRDYYASYRESSGFMMRSVKNIMLSLSLIILPYEWPTVISGEHIDIWIKEDTPDAFSEKGYEVVPSIRISNILAKSLEEISMFVTIQVAIFDNNPYYYNRELNICTNTIDLQMLVKSHINTFISIPNSVVVTLRHSQREPILIKGSVFQPNSSESHDVADMQVAVYQLRIPETGRLDLKFLNLEEGQTIRVRILYNKRPDYEFMIDKDSYIITKSSPNLSKDLKAPQSHDLYDLYYIGILPGSNHLAGTFLNYSFEMFTSHCVSWKFHEWSTRGCKINKAVEDLSLYCECEKLGTFAGAFQNPINKVDPLDNYELLMTEIDNLTLQIFLIFLWLASFLFLLLILFKDNTDTKGKVIYLEDNFPRDKFLYLIVVFSGSKFFGGTTSNVGIMLEGDKSCSRSHILKSSWCHTLEKGADDWFLMLTPHCLGNLKMIHLWMDFSGKRPDWYCYKVIVIDLLTHNKYLFLVDSWLALRGKDYVERFVKVVNYEDDKRLSIVVDNLIFGFHDTHLWLSVWWRHPRSIVSRAQRFTVAFNELLNIMLVSCLFLTVVEGINEDYPYYYLSSSVIFIVLISTVISATIANILISVFRETFIFKVGKEKPVSNNRNKNIKLKNYHFHKSTNFLFRCCENCSKVFVRKKLFKPVLLRFDNKGIPCKQKMHSLIYLLFGWIVTITMIMICLILIFYFSFRLKKNKSLVWLTCIALSLVLILFIITPLKICFHSVLSGLFYYNIYQTMFYLIRIKVFHKFKKNLLKSQKDLIHKLIQKRRHPQYLPLSYKKVMKKLYKQNKLDATLLLLDMVLIGILVILFLVQSETLWTTKYYWNNQEMKTLFYLSGMEEGIQLHNLESISHYSLFIETNILPVFFYKRWYNKQPIVNQNSSDDVSFVFGGTSKLFGLPRLRQIRLKQDLCHSPIYKNLSEYCNFKLDKDTKDTELYAEGWDTTGPLEKYIKLSPWSYLNESETYDATFYGFSNRPYRGDGYVAELDLTEEKSDDIAITLHREKWLDRLTCVVFFEVTIYNAYSGTFSWLVSVTENLHMGLLMNQVHVQTVSDDYKFPIIDIVFFLGLFMFMVRVFFVVNRNGIDDFADDFWNIFEIIMVCLGIICALLFLLNINSKFNYFQKTATGDTREKYFEFLHLLHYLDVFKVLLSILLLMLVCRFVKSWKFGKTFVILFRALFYKWGVVIMLIMIELFISFLYLVYLSYITNDFMTSKQTFPVMSKMEYVHIVKSCKSNLCKIIPFFLCLISFMIYLIISMLFLELLRTFKRKYIELEPMNFCTVFFERFKSYLFKVNHKGKKVLN